jgi:UDP-N-acetylmuramate dehydrogenase
MNEMQMKQLREQFGERLQEDVLMHNYSTMCIGGAADALLFVHSANEMEKTVLKLWELETPFLVLGSGSNLLISDKGIREVVVVNRAHNIRINTQLNPSTVWAESGAILAQVARQTALRGLSGLEWASAIPGTIGGAVYGNAGAFKRETAQNIAGAEMLEPVNGKVLWKKENFQYSYRSSILKRGLQKNIILTVTLEMEKGDPVKIKSEMEANRQKRLNTQPPGPSLGSIFRNPDCDKAGRLIEACGLKGKKIGDAEISPLHANFIINTGKAHAQDILDLILLIYQTVQTRFGIGLLPEVQIIGEWDAALQPTIQKINQGIAL